MKASRRRLFAVPAAAVLAGALGLSAAAPVSAAVPAARAQVVAQDVPAPGATGHLDAKKAKGPFPGLKAQQVLNKSVAAFKTAKYFRVIGVELANKDKYTFDVQVSQGFATGTFTSAAGIERAVRIGNTVYWQYDAKAIAAYEMPEQLEGKWIKLIPGGGPEWDQAAETMTPATWSKWMAGLRVSSRAAGPKIGGVPTVRLVQPSIKGGQVFVAASGPAFPLRVALTDRSATYTFSQYGKAFTVAAPPAGLVIDEGSAE